MSKRYTVSETELRVLKVLWSAEGLTVRQIAEQLYGSDGGGEVGAAEIGTVHSLLGRLESKKLVRRSRRTHPHQFMAKVTMAEVAGEEMASLLDRLGEQSFTPFLMHLISSKKLTNISQTTHQIAVPTSGPSTLSPTI